jgi:drug/metabolite transporter (DMT)-like permease
MFRSTSISDRTRGFSYAVASAFALSTTALFVRYLTDRHHLPAGVLSFWRAAFLVCVLFPVLAIARPCKLMLRRDTLGLVAGLGVLLAVFNLMWTTSVARCGASLATVLVYTSGPFTALLGRWLLRERLGPLGLTSIPMALVGCAVTSGALDRSTWRGDGIGIALGLVSGAFYALYTILGRVGARRGVDAWTLVLCVFSVNALTQLTFLVIGPHLTSTAPGVDALFWLGSRANGWAALAGLAAGPTLIGFGLYGASLRYLPSCEANLILTLEPPLTVAAAYWLLDETLKPTELLGSTLILAGVCLIHLESRRAPDDSSLTRIGGEAPKPTGNWTGPTPVVLALATRPIIDQSLQVDPTPGENHAEHIRRVRDHRRPHANRSGRRL